MHFFTIFAPPLTNPDKLMRNMKTRNIWKSLAALMCVAVMAIGLTACSEEEGEGIQIIVYTSEPTIGIMGDTGLEILMAVIDDYDKALKQAMGGDYCMSDKDEEVIAACDKVFQSHQSKYSQIEGTMDIRKTSSSSPSSEGTIIKTYTYEPSK